METSALRARVQAHILACEGEEHAGAFRVATMERLAGGACQDNFRVELESGAKWVLRSDARSSLPGSLDRAAELAVIRAAVAGGVKTPAPRWPSKGLVREGGNAYFLEWRDGEAIGRRVVKAKELESARARLAGELAQELAKIHAIRPSDHLDLMNAPVAASPSFHPASAMLAGMRARVATMDPSPSRELISRWLGEHLPPPCPASLVHGDFRTGNFLVTPAGLSAILDWEFAHWGAPDFDLAWLCVRDWRFGQLDRPVGGFARRAELYDAYTAASGRALDPKALQWWEIFGNLMWAVGSVQQAQRYLSGAESDIELIAIGRRAAEMEFEALRLIGGA